MGVMRLSTPVSRAVASLNGSDISTDLKIFNQGHSYVATGVPYEQLVMMVYPSSGISIAVELNKAEEQALYSSAFVPGNGRE